MPDSYEADSKVLNPLLNDAGEDADNDGFTNIQEYKAHSDPADPDDIPYVPITDLSFGWSTSCAIVDGGITCWGLMDSYPVPASLTAPEQVGVSASQFCARQGGDVTCWGMSYGALTKGLQAEPVNNARSLHVSSTDTACVVTTSGTVHCWGNDSDGMVTPPPGLNNVQQLDMFTHHVCAHDGVTVVCWGRDTSSQTEVPSDLGVPVQVVVGGEHTCVLQQDGQIRCWGDNSYHQTDVPADLGNVVALDAGGDFTCALNDLGRVHCWGRNQYGELDVPDDLVNVLAIHSGAVATCGDTKKGTVCWGNSSDTFGSSSIWYDLKDYAVGPDHVCGITDGKVKCIGSTVNEPNILDVPTDIVNPKVIGAGRFHTCVWSDNGMHCWGKAGNFLNFPAGLTNVTEISAGQSQTCAIDNGKVVCWGDNYHGVLNVPANITQAHELACGYQHNCVLDGGSVRCWGEDYRGQSSGGSYPSNPLTVAVGGVAAYPNSVDDGHTCAANETSVRCWGSNTYNVLAVPPGLTNVIDLYAGWGSTCAVTKGGAVVCWGDFMPQEKTDKLNIGNVTKIKGSDDAGICVQGKHKLKCIGGNLPGSVLLINRTSNL